MILAWLVYVVHQIENHAGLRDVGHKIYIANLSGMRRDFEHGILKPPRLLIHADEVEVACEPPAGILQNNVRHLDLRRNEKLQNRHCGQKPPWRVVPIQQGTLQRCKGRAVYTKLLLERQK